MSSLHLLQHHYLDELVEIFRECEEHLRLGQGFLFK
jgi:hypothetical protein